MSVLYIRDSNGNFVPIKSIQGEKGETGSVDNMPFGTLNPEALGTASTGTADTVSRSDHVHPMPSAEDVGARPDTWTPSAEDVGALPTDGTAADSAKLGGVAADSYALKSDIPEDSGADFLSIYPVGSIYMSVNSASPASLFGGTWEQLKDKFLLGAGDSYAAGATGGAATVNIAANNMPARALMLDVATEEVAWNAGVWSNNTPTDDNSSYANYAQNSSYGYGQPLDNMPPYLAVFIWKRVS